MTIQNQIKNKINSYTYISFGGKIEIAKRIIYPIYKVKILNINNKLNNFTIITIGFLFIENKDEYIKFTNEKYEKYKEKIIEKYKKEYNSSKT
ncbi:MAG: hypothetical protein ACI4RQ_03215 [Methanobrevibacter wolinii]